MLVLKIYWCSIVPYGLVDWKMILFHPIFTWLENNKYQVNVSDIENNYLLDP